MTIFLAILGVAILIAVGAFFYMQSNKKDDRIVFSNPPPPPPPPPAPKFDNSWEGIAKVATRGILGIGMERLDKLANPT